MTSPLVLIWPIGHPRFCGHSDTKGGPYDPPLVSLCVKHKFSCDAVFHVSCRRLADRQRASRKRE